MSERSESEQMYPSDEKAYRYPWERALMLVVLYGALMVFLWHFPTEGGRTFFRNLFQGLLYVLVGLALVGVTVLLLLLFPLRRISEDDEDFYDDEDGEDFVETVLPARALLVPAFKKPETEPRVWDVLYELEQDADFGGVILADAHSGIVTVTEASLDQANYSIRMIRERLKRAGFAPRNPR